MEVSEWPQHFYESEDIKGGNSIIAVGYVLNDSWEVGL